MATNHESIWLPEPALPDDTYARPGEHTLDWLARSTVARARVWRQFLNDNIAALPLASRDDFRDALRRRWQTAFFELIVARTLQILGASITVEVPTVSGRNPDYQAQFPDSLVTVEATAPVVNASMGNEMKARRPMLDFIEANSPGGWTVNVFDLPALGLSASQQEFRRAVSEMLAEVPAPEGAEQQQLTRELSTGTIQLWLIPKRYDRAVGIEPPVAVFDNTKARIRRAIGKKRSQVSGSESPVILAIHASGISSSLDDFDQALFGRTALMLNERRQVTGNAFRSDGEFAKNRDGAPTFAGVLAFCNVGFKADSDPVLYVHPRFAGKLPEALLALECRSYDAANHSIKVRPAKRTGVLRQFTVPDGI